MSQTPENLHEPIADLPNPELNPLLNPLLGRHLGQWAHVYFTTAPEKREEALYELIEDLKADEAKNGSAPSTEVTAETMSDGAYAIVCPRCERSNVRSQKYCGMCGSLMPVRAQAAAAASGSTGVGNAIFEEAYAPAEQEVDAPVEREMSEYQRPPRITEAESPFAATSLLFQPAADEVFEEPSPGQTPEAPTLQAAPVDIDWLRNRNFSSDVDDGNSKIVSYLLGIAVVICIGILVFLLAIRPNMHDKSAGEKPPVKWNISQNAPTQMPTVQDNGEAASAKPAEPAGAAQAPKVNTPQDNIKMQEGALAGRVGTEAAPASHPKKVVSKTKPVENAPAPVDDAEQSGAIEVAMARQYLSGTNGRPDGAAAAELLWKALRKQNSAALLMLSDLYATGNGVPKSCDQARTLLDAALRKNVPTADMKLRELQKTCP